MEALLGVVEGEEDGVGGGSGAGGAPGGGPCGHGFAAGVEGEGFVVGQVVGFAHEGIDGAHGVGFVLREDAEGVVEVFGFALGDGAAGCVSRGEFWGLCCAHAGVSSREGLSEAVSLPASAPPRRRSLAVLVTMGRDFRVL